MRILLISSVLFSSLVFATGSNAPKGSWRCSFMGQEWQTVPGPNGPSHELRPRNYTSDWKKTKQAAYDQAADDCENWSVTSCRFNSCHQKSR